MSIRDEKMTQRDRVTEGEQLNGLRDIKKGEDAKHLPLEKKAVVSRLLSRRCNVCKVLRLVHLPH